MADHPPNPANLGHTPPPPATWSQSSVAFTSRSASIATSVADDSEFEFDPTPLQSPHGGPDYDDLPPSYDEAQHQAVDNARNGFTPLDPNQIEAHRLTLNEGPNEPEIWEYRIRGEQLDDAEEHERAPAYDNFTNELGTHVPVRHVQNSENIPVGPTGASTPTPNTPHISTASLLERALSFTHHTLDGDVQYAPHMSRRIAVPQQGPVEHADDGISHAPAQFLRAYVKALYAHGIRPAEFIEFLDGLNALTIASRASVGDLLGSEPESVVQEYFRCANEGFFGPRGLRASLQPASALITALNIPANRGQRNGAVASVLDSSASAGTKALALYPWIEALEMNVPAQSTQSLILLEMVERLGLQHSTEDSTTPIRESRSFSEHEHEHDDPPHSIPDVHHTAAPSPGNRPQDRERGGHHSDSWSPLGALGQRPFGAPGHGPFGRCGPFSGRGRGRSRGRFEPRGHRAHGPPPFGPFRATNQSGVARLSSAANEWEGLGQDLGRWGEEFGKRMSEWGQQFGKQADAWGQDVGKRAEGLGEVMSTRASGNRGSCGISADTVAQVDDALPPSYQEGPSGQESGVLRDYSSSSRPPDYGDLSNHGESAQSAEASQPVGPAHRDDDNLSLSSNSSDIEFDSDIDSDSDTDSDLDPDDVPNTQARFLKRVASINKQVEDSVRKGKKSREEIVQERDSAIEEAQNDKTFMEFEIVERTLKQAARREHKQKRRELMREHRHKKRALKATFSDKGKRKGKAKKTPEWKQTKKEYRKKKKALKKEQARARQKWKEAEAFRRATLIDNGDSVMIEQSEALDNMVWIVIDNLDS